MQVAEHLPSKGEALSSNSSRKVERRKGRRKGRREKGKKERSKPYVPRERRK
jgi:hypothetical protein